MSNPPRVRTRQSYRVPGSGRATGGAASIGEPTLATNVTCATWVQWVNSNVLTQRTTSPDQTNDTQEQDPRTFADVENGDPEEILEELDAAIL